MALVVSAHSSHHHLANERRSINFARSIAGMARELVVG